MIVDLNLQIDGLNVKSEDELIDFIKKLNEECDSIYDINYDYEIVEVVE